MVEVKTSENYAKQKRQLCMAIGPWAGKKFQIVLVAAAVHYGRPSTAICVVVKACIRQAVKDSPRTITDEG